MKRKTRLNVKSRAAYWKHIFKVLLDANFKDEHPKAMDALIKIARTDLKPGTIELHTMIIPEIKLTDRHIN